MLILFAACVTAPSPGDDTADSAVDSAAPADTLTLGAVEPCAAPVAPGWSNPWGGEPLDPARSAREALLEPGALAVVGDHVYTISEIGQSLGADWRTKSPVGPTAWSPLLAGFSLADLQGDGAADLLLSGPSPGLVPDVSGPQSPKSNLLFEPVTDGFVRDLVPADFTGDGLLDLYVQFTSSGDGAPDLLPVLAINRGDGAFVSTLPVDAAEGFGGAALDATAFDADGDSDTDLLVCHVAGDSAPLQLLLNDTGRFRPADPPPFASTGACQGVALASLGADGRPGFVATFADRVERWRPTAEGWALDEPLPLDPPPADTRYRAALPADLDNDGDEDLVVALSAAYVADAVPAATSIVWNDGGASRVEPLVAEGFVRAVVLRDLSGDGVLDLFLGDAQATPRVFPSDGCSAGAWLEVTAPLGTRVTATGGGVVVASGVVATESGAGSAGEPTLHLGLGALDTLDSVELAAPGGLTRTIPGPLDARRRVRWSP